MDMCNEAVKQELQPWIAAHGIDYVGVFGDVFVCEIKRLVGALAEAEDHAGFDARGVFGEVYAFARSHDDSVTTETLKR